LPPLGRGRRGRSLGRQLGAGKRGKRSAFREKAFKYTHFYGGKEKGEIVLYSMRRRRPRGGGKKAGIPCHLLGRGKGNPASVLLNHARKGAFIILCEGRRTLPYLIREVEGSLLAGRGERNRF